MDTDAAQADGGVEAGVFGWRSGHCTSCQREYLARADCIPQISPRGKWVQYVAKRCPLSRRRLVVTVPRDQTLALNLLPNPCEPTRLEEQTMNIITDLINLLVMLAVDFVQELGLSLLLGLVVLID